MIRTSSVALFAAMLASASTAVLSGCSAGADVTPAEDTEHAGEINLDLTVAGATVNSVSYVITRPAGYTKSGSFDLTNSNTVSGVIGGIPVGTGYSITLSATATDGVTTCAGSASFTVVARATTPVSIALTCHQPSRNGSVSINGTLNLCPVLDGVSASPSAVLVGSSISLSADAHDADAAPAALVYHWSASSGSFSDPSSKSPSFTCAAPGIVTITVSASDGDPAASCADSNTVQVKCSIPAFSVSKTSIALYGDAPYGTTPTDTSETLATPAFIAAVNADPDVSLVLHVGDIHSGKQYCTEEYNRTVFDLWKAFQDPLVYTPGDNEWSDCHKAAEGGGTYNPATQQIDYVLSGGVPVDYAKGDPLANLSLVRSIFFAQPGMTLGGRKRVLSQSQFFDPTHPTDASYVENVMFEQSKVLFVSVNLPGGSNDDNDIWYGAPVQSAAQSQEIVERRGADLRWLDVAFAQAQADGMTAVLIELQADMWDAEKGAAHQAEYEPYVKSIASHTTAFAKPVLLVNGDSHIYLSDNPLAAGAPLAFMHPGYDVPNFHRIVVHGSTIPLEWLKMSIDPAQNAGGSADAFGPFSWTRMIQP